MISWQQFLENLVADIDFSQIEQIYDKAHIAVDLVKLYQPNLLEKISVIANQSSGVYGTYTSGQTIEKDNTIHVNVGLIVQTKKTELEIILEIAATIIHEACHKTDMATKGTSDEKYPKQAEAAFISWVKSDWEFIVQELPELAQVNT